MNLRPESACSSLAKMIDCIAKDVQEECGDDSLRFMVDITNEYMHNLLPSDECMLSVPTIALETGCSEQQLIQYLECEALVDNFRFRPITFIRFAYFLIQFYMIDEPTRLVMLPIGTASVK